MLQPAPERRGDAAHAERVQARARDALVRHGRRAGLLEVEAVAVVEGFEVASESEPLSPR